MGNFVFVSCVRFSKKKPIFSPNLPEWLYPWQCPKRINSWTSLIRLIPTEKRGRKSGLNRPVQRETRLAKKAKCMYEDKGVLLHDGADLCDCLRSSCPGCYFPCTKCRSPKCAHDCRIHRRSVFESIEVEGTALTVKNEHLPQK